MTVWRVYKMKVPSPKRDRPKEAKRKRWYGKKRDDEGISSSGSYESSLGNNGAANNGYRILYDRQSLTSASPVIVTVAVAENHPCQACVKRNLDCNSIQKPHRFRDSLLPLRCSIHKFTSILSTHSLSSRLEKHCVTCSLAS